MVAIFWKILRLLCLISTALAQGNFEKYRDDCLVENSLTLQELNVPMPTIDDTPEVAWCLVRCMGMKFEVIGEDGTVDTGKLAGNTDIFFLPMIRELTTCGNEVGKIETCDDMKKIKECLKKLISTRAKAVKN